MSKAVTIDDVARAAGVTKGTVSLVYSGKRKISERTRERVLAAAAALDWEPSHSARALATERSSTIGIVLARDPRIIASDSFFAQFLAGVESVLSDHNLALLLQIVPTHEREVSAYRALSRGRVDAMILLDLNRDEPRLELMDSLNLPAVIVGAYGPGTTIPQVFADDGASIRALVDHLTSLGHTSIGFVGGVPGLVHSHIRKHAFIERMKELGLDATHTIDTDFTAKEGAQAADTLLDSPTPPTAIMCASDLLAISVLSKARQRGLRIPEDLSVTGFDDSELAAHLSPGLTTVDTDAFERGQCAARLIVALLDGHEVLDQQLDINRIMLRGSTGPAFH